MSDLSDRIFWTGVVGLVFLSALFVGLSQLFAPAAPRLALNGAAGSLLAATMLLILIARMWRRIEIVPTSDVHVAFSLEESRLQYGSALLFGLCLICLGGLGLSGYTGQNVEIIAGALLVLVGLGVLTHVFWRGRARLALSPTGIAHCRTAVIAWDRIAGVRLSALPWRPIIYVDIKHHAGADARRLQLNPKLLGADPTALFEMIAARRNAFTF